MDPKEGCNALCPQNFVPIHRKIYGFVNCNPLKNSSQVCAHHFNETHVDKVNEEEGEGLFMAGVPENDINYLLE